MDRNEASVSLIAVAEAAQDVAAGLHKFISPVSDCDADITALIAKCFDVSSALRDLVKAINECRRLAQYHRISGEVQDTCESLDHSFKDVHQIVGEGFADAKRAKTSQTAAYRRVWRNIDEHFRSESGNPLVRRLEYCRLLLIDLYDILREGYLQKSRQF